MRLASKTIVRCEQVTKTYASGALTVQALRGASFSLEAGAFATLAGPSGSGKSTLLNLIGGLDRPTSGLVEIDGVDTRALDGTALSKLRRERIGFVFQAYNLIPVLTAAENAEYVLLLQGRPEAERQARVREVLKSVGLEGLEERTPRELSGGQQQRVAIARAIAARPALVLADEPTANLDSKTAASLMELMETLNREHGVTFLFSTHDPALIKRARRVLMLHDGEITHDGPPETVPHS
ncbi:MAG: ABC transporter ATP-binding protein [Deltaproteobacteria bacterium]|nr:ABC transporter ATP-binding protein [Deltaproteobacteria bacterium]